ncbi:MAG: hypothetical protein KBC53_09095 [Nitrosomonas sp.]|nr:hypothetical protein [Nitrosomonas sp.]
MIVRVPNCGQYGVNNDLSQHELPINVWTDAQNIRFLDGYINQVLGYGEVYGTPSITPHHVLPVIIAGARYWIYASLAKIYCTTITAGAAVHTNLTRQTAGNDVDYTATANSWTSTVLGGVPILNPGNATDVPQFWDLNTANNFAALTNWPASTYCKSMRAYKNSLVALNITKSSTNYPYMIKWSHPAVPGAVPSSWDETDPTLDAGEFDLAEGYDHIIDGLPLGDSLIVYKEASVWRIDYTGGQSIYSTRKVLGTSGAMNRNCIVEIDGYHVVLTNNDIVIHDGTQAISILDKKTRRWFFQHIDVDEFSRCFVFKNPFFNEVSICYPSIGADYCDSAIVYNYVDKTISKRAMPNVHHANYGQVENSLVGTWAGDSDPWSSDLTLWDGPDYVPNYSRVMLASNTPKLYMLDSSSSFAGVIPSAYVERKGLSFGVPEKIKLVKSIKPRITGNVGDTVIVSIGSQDDPYETPTYTTMTHTIGDTVANNCLVAGRYISVKFSTGTAYNWRLDSYDLDIEQIGDW